MSSIASVSGTDSLSHRFDRMFRHMKSRRKEKREAAIVRVENIVSRFLNTPNATPVQIKEALAIRKMVQAVKCEERNRRA